MFQIAAAQIPSYRGDMARNLATHAAAIAAASRQEVSCLVFPELSLIGYEPALGPELAVALDDPGLELLGSLAQEYRMTLVVGAALKSEQAKPWLGAVIFSPSGERTSYAKMHLGGDEPLYFAAGDQSKILHIGGEAIGLAICADTSRPSHPQSCSTAGAGIYAASVFLNKEWYPDDFRRLAGYAKQHQMLVLMANHGASIGTLQSVGQSTIWGPDGTLLAQASGTEEALLIARRNDQTWEARIVPL